MGRASARKRKKYLSANYCDITFNNAGYLFLSTTSFTVSAWASNSEADVWHFDGYDIAMM